MTNQMRNEIMGAAFVGVQKFMRTTRAGSIFGSRAVVTRKGPDLFVVEVPAKDGSVSQFEVVIKQKED